MCLQTGKYTTHKPHSIQHINVLIKQIFYPHNIAIYIYLVYGVHQHNCDDPKKMVTPVNSNRALSEFHHTWMTCKVKILLLWSFSSHNSWASSKGDSRGPQLRIWIRPTLEHDARQKRVSSPVSLTDCHFLLLLMMVVSSPSSSRHMTAGRSWMPLVIT